MKAYERDVLILVIPVIVMILLIPVLPNKIPMQFDTNGNASWYLDKKLSFLIGFTPFILYKLYRLKRGYK